MSKIKPLSDRLVVREDKAASVTKGGIQIPDSAQEKPQRGTVIAIGPGKLLDSGERAKLEVKKGDRIVFGQYAGTTVELDEEEFRILSEDDIHGIIEE